MNRNPRVFYLTSFSTFQLLGTRLEILSDLSVLFGQWLQLGAIFSLGTLEMFWSLYWIILHLWLRQGCCKHPYSHSTVPHYQEWSGPKLILSAKVQTIWVRAKENNEFIEAFIGLEVLENRENSMGSRNVVLMRVTVGGKTWHIG